MDHCNVQIDCHLRSDGSSCPGYPYSVTIPVTIRVYFDSAKYAVSAADVARLQKFVTRAIAAGAKHMTVIGFADPSGSVAYNAWLSEQRAQHVATLVRSAVMSAMSGITTNEHGNGVASSGRSYADDRYVTVTFS